MEKLSLEKNPMVEMEIEPGTSWLVANDVTTEPSSWAMSGIYWLKIDNKSEPILGHTINT